MERRLILMRHAKSAWDTGAPDDHARPLAGRGRKDAPRVAERLAELGWTPDAVVSSDSERTRETWERMADLLDVDEVIFTPALYHAGVDELRDEAEAWPDGWRTVMAVGHNPGWEEAVAELTGVAERMTTGNAALLVGRGATWIDALYGDWRLEEVLRPKELE